MIRSPRWWAALVAALALLTGVLSGCTGPSRSGSDQPGVAGPASVVPGPAGVAQRTSIASSSIKDLSAALRNNGVEDPEKWAEIVAEYRPYDAGRAGEDKLREVLTRFQADPDTTTKVTTALTP